MSTTLLVTIVTETCYKCGIPFGLEANFRNQRLNDHGNFYCPNGHCQHYIGETEAEKLKKQLDNARQRVRSAEAREQSWRDQAETAEARRRGEKAAKTRLKKRIAAGVCPCCNRSFMDLQRHMQGQHPGYTVEG